MRKFLTCAVLVFTLSVLATAQEAPKAEVFGGFSYLHLDTKGAAGVEANHYGWNGALSLNANRWFGITADLSGHYRELAPGVSFNSFTAVFGPQLTYRAEKASPFVHALFGVNRGSTGGLSDSAFAMALGGGLDINITKRLAFRLVQADYLMTKHSDDTQNNIRLSTGLVLKLGGGPPPAPMAASCSIRPSEVMAGEPLTLTVTTSNVPKNHTVSYGYTGTGGKVEGKDATASVDTTGLAPGSYTVTATVTDTKSKKAAPATCNSSFSIKAPPMHPPTISCSANPSTVRSGDPSNITAIGQSPDNRPLTYGFTASGGRLTPSGAQATLDTTGAPAGPITINCTTTDDRGLSASTRATVNVEVPPPPLEASKCGTIEFSRDQRRPWRVDNEAKAILDDCALRLQREAGARGVIVGNADPNEKNAANMAMQRAVNTKDYLVREKGIDPARLEVRTGSGGTQTVDIWVVPAGATFNVEGTQTFDESKGMAQPRTAPRRKAAVK
jgi:hypothetical protein